MTMEDKPFVPATDAEIQALLDNVVPEPERAALEARIQQDPTASERLAQWSAQRDAIRALHADLLNEPVPETLLAAAGHSIPSGDASPSWRRWGGVAASICLAFGAGWLSHNQWTGPDANGTATVAQRPGPIFLREAVLAHAVYAPEIRHPVEVAASEQVHLIQWLSKRTGKALKIPDLSTHGYLLVGGRLLPGEAGPRAQFMFESPQGQRVTLYLGALAQSADQKPQPTETAFRFAADGPVPAFYWVDQGFGYALSGPLSRDALMQLSELVYRQL